jgi:glyoxylate carboligase
VRERGLGKVVGPIDLYRDEVNYVQPDISYFTTEQLSQITQQQIRQVPPLSARHTITCAERYIARQRWRPVSGHEVA